MQMYAHLKHVQKILSNSLQSPLKFHGFAFARSLYILLNVKYICHLSFPSHKTKQNLPWRWGNRLPPTKPSLVSAPAKARLPTEISAWHRHLATVPSGNKGPPPCQIPWPLASDRPSTYYHRRITFELQNSLRVVEAFLPPQYGHIQELAGG